MNCVEVFVVTTDNVQSLINKLVNINQSIQDDLDKFLAKVEAKVESIKGAKNIALLKNLPPAQFYLFCQGLIDFDQASVCAVELSEITQIVMQGGITKVYVKFEIAENFVNDFIKINDYQILQGFDSCISEE